MKRLLLLGLTAVFCAGVAADEGMWTFDNFPKAAVRQKYGIEISDAWLKRLQTSVVWLESGAGFNLPSNCPGAGSTQSPGSICRPAPTS
jgi:hypothetical protein